MKRTNKLCTLLLAAMLVIGMMPIRAEAAGNEAAEVGGVKYATLQEAVNQAKEGETVTLLSDVSENIETAVDDDFVLELNGYTLSGGTVSGKAALKNNGTITIQDSSAGKTGMIKREDNRTAGYYTIDNQGSMTILSGSVYNNSGVADSTGKIVNGASLIRNGGVSSAAANELVISGGDLRQQNFIVVKNDDYGKLTVTGGKLVSRESSVQNWADADISGGELEGLLWTSVWSNTFAPANTSISGNAIITGEIVVDRYDASVTTTPELEISGGVLDVGWSRVAAGEGVAVSGGVFSNAGVMDFVNEDEMALSVSRDGEEAFFVGTYTDMVFDVVEEGDVLNVLQNIASIEGLPDGITVNNKSTDTVEINGKEIAVNASGITGEKDSPDGEDTEKPAPVDPAPADPVLPSDGQDTIQTSGDGEGTVLAPKTYDMANLPTLALVLIGCAVAGLCAVKKKEV